MNPPGGEKSARRGLSPVTLVANHKPSCFETLRKSCAPQHEDLWWKHPSNQPLMLKPLTLRSEALAQRLEGCGAVMSDFLRFT